MEVKNRFLRFHFLFLHHGIRVERFLSMKGVDSAGFSSFFAFFDAILSKQVLHQYRTYFLTSKETPTFKGVPLNFFQSASKEMNETLQAPCGIHFKIICSPHDLVFCCVAIGIRAP